jgi:hypothetical protein
MKPQPTTAINFNYDVHVKELTERFNRLIKQLGPNNRKDWKATPPVGSMRYNFEVDFMYALHEIQNSPSYLQGKMFDQASGIVNALINQLKIMRENGNQVEAQEAQEA